MNIPHTMQLSFVPPVTKEPRKPPLLKMFSVDIRHTYYAATGDRCPDFVIEPIPASRTLMAELGMMMRAEEYGFSVYIGSDRLQQLTDYLLAPPAPGAAPGFWQSLSFCLRVRNSAFINFTRLPIGTTLMKQNLYLSNLHAHVEDRVTLLCKGDYVAGNELQEVVGRDLTLKGPPGALVEVRDQSGAVVYPARTEEIKFDEAGYAWITLANLPYGLYEIYIMYTLSRLMPRLLRKVLYLAQQVDGLALVNVLFTAPRADSAGVYPVARPSDPKSPAELTQPAYRLPFEARQTYWRYFFVSQDPKGRLQRLRIHGEGTHFTQMPEPTILPDGSRAIELRADTALPLRQRSPYAFSLTGRRRSAADAENPLRIARLPVARSDQVWTKVDDQFPEREFSEIYTYV